MEKIYLILLLFLSSCTFRPAFTQDHYQLVQIGTNISVLEEQYGPPYDIKEIGNDVSEYRYIERVEIGSQRTEHTHYIFTVSQGRIVGKHCQNIGEFINFKTP